MLVKGFADKILESPEVLNILVKQKGDKGDIFIQKYKDLSKVIDCAVIFKEFADKEISSKISLLLKAWEEIDMEVKNELNTKQPATFNYLQTMINELNN